jgi:hypothetical protein
MYVYVCILQIMSISIIHSFKPKTTSLRTEFSLEESLDLFFCLY